MTLSSLREKIDALDRQLISLLGERLEIAREIARVKKKQSLPIFDPSREEAIKKEIRSLAQVHRLSASVVGEIFDLLLNYSKLEMERLS